MEFIVKKTNECNDKELHQMNDLFNTVFEKDRSFGIMLNQYTQNPLGYSYHSLIIDDGTIVGMNTSVPVFFKKDGEKVLFAAGIDSAVRKKYRDFFNYQDMVLAGNKYMKKEGVKFAYGYPNDNAYPIVIKSKLSKEIGRMYTFCLPYRIGGIKKKFNWLNWASIFFCWSFVRLCSIFASPQIATYRIEKDLNSYNVTRYKRSDGNYCMGRWVCV